MKLLRRFAAVLAAVCLISAAFAGDPSGTWKWTAPMGGRGGGGGGGEKKGPPRETTLTLAMKDGKLTGSLSSPGRGGDPMTTEISDASVKDDMVMFSVTRPMQKASVTTKYVGKLAGDTITGTIERPGMNGGEAMKTDWTATRAK